MRSGSLPKLALLRLVGLKGRASVDILAESLSLSSDDVVASYAPLCEERLCTNSSGILRLTPAGRDRVTVLLANERADADRAAVIALYEDFCVFNAELKQIMTAWQLKSDGAPNDHRDDWRERTYEPAGCFFHVIFFVRPRSTRGHTTAQCAIDCALSHA